MNQNKQPSTVHKLAVSTVRFHKKMCEMTEMGTAWARNLRRLADSRPFTLITARLPQVNTRTDLGGEKGKGSEAR